MRKVVALVAVCAVAGGGAVAGPATAKKPKKWWEVVILHTPDQIYAKSCAGTTYKVEKEEASEGGKYEVQKTFKSKTKAQNFMKHAPGCEGSSKPSLESDSKSK